MSYLFMCSSSNSGSIVVVVYLLCVRTISTTAADDSWCKNDWRTLSLVMGILTVNQLVMKFFSVY